MAVRETETLNNVVESPPGFVEAALARVVPQSQNVIPVLDPEAVVLECSVVEEGLSVVEVAGGTNGGGTLSGCEVEEGPAVEANGSLASGEGVRGMGGTGGTAGWVGGGGRGKGDEDLDDAGVVFETSRPVPGKATDRAGTEDVPFKGVGLVTPRPPFDLTAATRIFG